MKNANVKEDMVKLVKEMLSTPFYITEGCGEVLALERGSRPGNSLADILFAYVSNAYVSALNKELHDNDLQVHIPASDETFGLWPTASMDSATVRDQTYVDDTALYLSETTNQLLGLKIRLTLDIVFRVITSFWV